MLGTMNLELAIHVSQYILRDRLIWNDIVWNETSKLVIRSQREYKIMG